MDFDYQKIKDEESRQRDDRISALPLLQPRPNKARPYIATEPSSVKKPPIKPRRSIKSRPVTQPGSGQSSGQAGQTETEERKRISPSQVLNPTGPLDAQTPSLQAHNLLWFQRTQLPRLPKPIPCWLHGFITRREAEQLLQDKPRGCFLLRLSESKVGFVLSYRGADKCRHFIIEEDCDVSRMQGRYSIAGEHSKHCSLDELINYYTHNPVGPFNELLTVACAQSNGMCEDKTKLDVRYEEIVASPQGNTEHPPSAPDAPTAPAAPEPVQYAVVKKVLRKTHSLSEFMTETIPPPVQEYTDRDTKTELERPEPVLESTDMCIGGEEADPDPVNAPYARVNKPQRSAQPSSISDSASSVLVPSAASNSQGVSSAAAAEQKYWELEPLHTYEEALHTRPREDQIDFYAVGRQRELSRDTGASSANHIYSEVNIKGTTDNPIPASQPLCKGTTTNSTQPVTRPIPRIPPRPTPRPVHTTGRPESNTQNFSVPGPRNTSLFPSEQPPKEHSIYEQIPERPNRTRPPRPPPNPKR